jgi:hypothetical protein
MGNEKTKVNAKTRRGKSLAQAAASNYQTHSTHAHTYTTHTRACTPAAPGSERGYARCRRPLTHARRAINRPDRSAHACRSTTDFQPLCTTVARTDRTIRPCRLSRPCVRAVGAECLNSQLVFPRQSLPCMRLRLQSALHIVFRTA